MEIHANEMLGTRDRLNKILAKHTGQSVERIKHDTDRDRFMNCRRRRSLRPGRPRCSRSVAKRGRPQ